MVLVGNVMSWFVLSNVVVVLICVGVMCFGRLLDIGWCFS